MGGVPSTNVGAAIGGAQQSARNRVATVGLSGILVDDQNTCAFRHNSSHHRQLIAQASTNSQVPYADWHVFHPAHPLFAPVFVVLQVTSS